MARTGWSAPPRKKFLLAVFGFLFALVVVSMFMPICATVSILVPGISKCLPDRSDAGALGALQNIHNACERYSSIYGHGYPESLARLGGTGIPTASSAQLVDNELAAGEAGGYNFIYVPGPSDAGAIRSYAVTAEPSSRNAGAHRYFYTDQTGLIRFATDGPAGAGSPPVR